MAIAKIKCGLNLLFVAPLAVGFAFISSGISTVQAQTTQNNTVEYSTQLPERITQFSISNQLTPAETFLQASQHQTVSLAEQAESTNLAATKEDIQPSSQIVTAEVEDVDSKQLPQTKLIETPFPGTTTTEATALSAERSPVNQPSMQTDAPQVAQLPIDPGRRTRGGSSYVGVGANIGLSGDTALGDGNFTIISKIGLTRALALRPSVILGDDAMFLLPLTYEFSIRQAEALEEALRIAPYVGAGVIIYTGDDDDDANDEDGGIGLLLTGGVDIPLSRQFTANAGLNVGIGDETDIGLSVGVGYNFGAFGL